MKKTSTKIFAMCLAATMVGTTTNFTTRTLAVEKTQPTVQSISDKATKKIPGISVKKITLDKRIDLQVGTGATKTTQQLLAKITPANATNKNVTWMSSNTKVATVSSTGLVTAVKAGSATITATSEDGHKKASSKITVTAFTAGSSDQIDSLWTQKWNDEFSGVNGTTTDASKWVFDIGKGPNGDGWGNQELETYTSSTDNVYQKDGNLVIAAKKDATGNITSGRIKTKGSLDMKYGRVDVKAKLPTGAGYWPAIWMLPTDNVYGVWASSGEIDIMENKGRLPNEVYGTLHYGAAWPNNRYTGKAYNFPSGTDVTSFHTYSMEWEPGEIRWYVDGHLYQTQNNWNTTDTNGEKVAFPAPFDQNFHLILNLAYGGTFDGSVGDKSNIPGEMEIDYVRAYDLTGRPYKTAVEPIVNAEVLPAGAKQADSSGNLLSNGDFSLPIKENPTGLLPLAYDWNFVHSTDTGTGTQTIEQIGDKKYAKINVTNPGAKNYSVQLMQETTLGKGRWYKLSFDAKTDTSRNIGVKIGGGPSRGYASYADPAIFDLTDQFQSFETTFQMTEDTDVIGRIEYELGLSTNPVWIGNTRLEEISAPVQNADASKEPLSDGNRIYNGTFDKGSIDRMA